MCHQSSHRPSGLSIKLKKFVTSDIASTLMSMNSIHRLCEVGKINIDELRALIERINLLDENPQSICAALNDKTTLALFKAGGMDLFRGTALLLTAVAADLLALSHGYFNVSLQWLLIVAGIAFVGIGIRNRAPLEIAISTAMKHRDTLERNDGFLWRFQTLLEFRDADGPIAIHKSLIRSCEDSKLGRKKLSRTELKHYWYWIHQVDNHLQLAAEGQHDHTLDDT